MLLSNYAHSLHALTDLDPGHARARSCAAARWARPSARCWPSLRAVRVERGAGSKAFPRCHVLRRARHVPSALLPSARAAARRQRRSGPRRARHGSRAARLPVSFPHPLSRPPLKSSQVSRCVPSVFAACTDRIFAGWYAFLSCLIGGAGLARVAVCRGLEQREEGRAGTTTPLSTSMRWAGSLCTPISLQRLPGRCYSSCRARWRNVRDAEVLWQT